MRTQIVRNAPLLTFFLPVERTLVARWLPSTLKLHSKARLVLNMWSIDSASESTGFGTPGPLGVSYLAVEVAGDEGMSLDGAFRFPGRLWLRHWSSHDADRAYAKQIGDLDVRPGDTKVRIDGDRVEATLNLDGALAVRASARLCDTGSAPRSGYSVYYGMAATPPHKVTRFDIPWISEGRPLEHPSVEFFFGTNEIAAPVVEDGQQAVSEAFFRRMTLVPYAREVSSSPPIESAA